VTWASTSFELDGDVVVRLLAAAVLGGLVGIEREASDQPAGLRTHIAVALGASLFGVISTLGFLEFDQPRARSTIQADVTRVASNVVVGIGFLGAGVIFRQGNTIRNLTTAASLWTVAAIGLACGVGDVTTAGIASAVLLVSLVLLRPLRTLIRRHWASASVTVRVQLRPGVDPDVVIDQFGGDGVVDTSQFSVRKEKGRLVLVSDITASPTALRRWMSEVATSPDVETVTEE
jgi:putative Mg2+ transporter-C (MgtC) family protein